MFEWLRESLWGYPIVAAIHVLGLAWFGGTVLVDRGTQTLKRIGLALMILSGAVLFGMHAGRYGSSFAFQIKLLLLVALAFPLPRRVSLALWIAIILASRGIAFF
jgi:hypothetical protein